MGKIEHTNHQETVQLEHENAELHAQVIDAESRVKHFERKYHRTHKQVKGWYDLAQSSMVQAMELTLELGALKLEKSRQLSRDRTPSPARVGTPGKKVTWAKQTRDTRGRFGSLNKVSVPDDDCDEEEEEVEVEEKPVPLHIQYANLDDDQLHLLALVDMKQHSIIQAQERALKVYSRTVFDYRTKCIGKHAVRPTVNAEVQTEVNVQSAQSQTLSKSRMRKNNRYCLLLQPAASQEQVPGQSGANDQQ